MAVDLGDMRRNALSQSTTFSVVPRIAQRNDQSRGRPNIR